MIHRGQPERRAMVLTRIATGGGDELCVANLHATNDRPDLAVADVLGVPRRRASGRKTRRCSSAATSTCGPTEDPVAFERLRDEFGLEGTTGPRAIDHLLARGLEVVTAPTPWPDERRERPRGNLCLRLSDHAPVEARFKTGSP